MTRVALRTIGQVALLIWSVAAIMIATNLDCNELAPVAKWFLWITGGGAFLVFGQWINNTSIRKQC